MTFYAPAAHKRRANDHYPTPPDLAQALPLGLALAGLDLPRPLHDPCAGEGALLAALGRPAFGSDLRPEAYQKNPLVWPASIDASDPEALESVLGVSRSIVTNPPYGRDADAIVRASLQLVKAGRIELAAFLLPVPWETAGSRVDVLRDMAVRIVPCWRSTWVPGTKGNGKMNYVWLVWTSAPPPAFPVTVYLRKLAP